MRSGEERGRQEGRDRRGGGGKGVAADRGAHLRLWGGLKGA